MTPMAILEFYPRISHRRQMDGLLHWDFSPGLRVEAQVRARFGSTIHFVSNPNSEEFFLEVSFSSTSFPSRKILLVWLSNHVLEGSVRGSMSVVWVIVVFGSRWHLIVWDTLFLAYEIVSGRTSFAIFTSIEVWPPTPPPSRFLACGH